MIVVAAAVSAAPQRFDTAETQCCASGPLSQYAGRGLGRGLFWLILMIGAHEKMPLSPRPLPEYWEREESPESAGDSSMFESASCVKVDGGHCSMRFLVLETKTPHATSLEATCGR